MKEHKVGFSLWVKTLRMGLINLNRKRKAKMNTNQTNQENDRCYEPIFINRFEASIIDVPNIPNSKSTKHQYRLFWHIVDKYGFERPNEKLQMTIRQEDIVVFSQNIEFLKADMMIEGEATVLVDDITTYPLSLTVIRGIRNATAVFPNSSLVIKDFYATPHFLYKRNKDNRATLYWDIVNATSAVLDDGEKEYRVKPKDSLTVYLDETRNFVLKAFSMNGEARTSLKVEVLRKQRTVFYAQPITGQANRFLLKWKVEDARWVYLDDEKVKFEEERIIDIKEERIITLKVRDDINITSYPIKLSPNYPSSQILPMEIKVL